MHCLKSCACAFSLSMRLPWKSERPLTSLSQWTIALKAWLCGSSRSKTDRKKSKILSYSPVLLFCYTNRKVLGEKKVIIKHSIFLKTPGHWFKKLLSFTHSIHSHYPQPDRRILKVTSITMHISFKPELRSAITYEENSNFAAKPKNSASSLPSVPLSDQCNSKCFYLIQAKEKNVHKLF